jgi:hypothetical protein
MGKTRSRESSNQTSKCNFYTAASHADPVSCICRQINRDGKINVLSCE